MEEREVGTVDAGSPRILDSVFADLETSLEADRADVGIDELPPRPADTLTRSHPRVPCILRECRCHANLLFL